VSSSSCRRSCALPKPDDGRPLGDAELTEPEDPEAAPAIPSASVAAHAAALRLSDARGPAASVSALVTDAEIWRLAWPVILSQVLASAVSLIDLAMLGRLGPNTLAAVGYVTQFFWLSNAVLMAVGVAGVALVSQALGAGDAGRARAALGGCILVSIVVSAAVAGTVIGAPRPILGLLNASPAVIDTALPYLRLTMASTLLFAVSISLESGFRAARDTRTPLAVAAVVTAVKTALNGLWIFGPFGLPRYGLAGAGLATVVAQAVAVVLLWAAARRRGLAPSFPDVRALRAGAFGAAAGSGGSLPRLVRLAIPAMLERVVLNAALMEYFAMLGRYGSATIAAYTVGVRMMSFSWIPGIGFSAAAATLVGHAMGADDPAAASRAGWRAVRFALGVSSVLGVAFALGRAPLARVFTDDTQVIGELGPFMLTLALAQPLLGYHFTLSGALRGAGDTVSPLVAATVGNWAFRVPLALVFQHLGLDVTWMWLALVCDHAARASWVSFAYLRGGWRGRGSAAPAT
jgi:MATE family multidrug resistance protein